MELAELTAAFVAATPKADIWRRYPDVSSAEDDATDTYACEALAAAFADFAAGLGVSARVVYAEDAEEPFVDYHVWTRVETTDGVRDVDWTARQYHNLDGVRDAALDAPWPLVWPPSDAHPLAGRFDTVLIGR
jgi:hypothetical protein